MSHINNAALESLIDFCVFCFLMIISLRVLFGDLKINIPTHIKIFDIVDESPVEEAEISINEVSKPKKKTKKKKIKKKNKKLSKLKSDCVLALRSLGVKASEASAEVERIYRENKDIKTVEEFLTKM